MRGIVGGMAVTVRIGACLGLAFSAALLMVWSVRYAAPVAMLVVRLVAPRLRRASS